MNQTTNTATETFECPKCFGAGYFRIFSHVEHGVCFLCGGARVATRAQISGWLRAQMGNNAMPMDATAGTGGGDIISRKSVEIRGFGLCEIQRLTTNEDGEFVVYVQGANGSLPAWFDVRNGKVKINLTCDGLIASKKDLESCLQLALKK